MANKVHPGQENSIRDALDFLPLLGILPYDPEVINADLAGRALIDTNLPMLDIIRQIKLKLEN